MAALESGDAATLCVFDKIGWGQWEAKVVPREEFNARAAAIVASSGSSANASASEGVNPPSLGKSSLRRRRNSDRHSISPTGKGLSSSAPSAGFSGKKDHRRSSNSPVRNLTALRRESITNPNTDLHNTKVPGSPTLQPLQTLRNSFRAHNISLDEAIESSSDEEGAAEEGFEIHSHGSVSSGSSPGSGANDDGELFNFESEQQQQLANSRHILRTRSLSSSTNRRPSFGGVAKPRKPRTSFTSHSIEAALDEGAIDSRRPRISFSNPSSVSRQSYLRTSISPRSNPIMIHEQMSSLSIGSGNSTSESGINQIQNKPKKSSGLAGVQQESENYTDEEDWEAMGPSSLRNRNSSSSTNVVSVKKEPERKDEEMTAAIALMDLRTVN
ncbi:DEKNAAC100812 [Brettanomyces naardenensis]|uniref:DEKNAAC100812 n=1 Tax=Brettanomyces naardenensis TaxID=13370 RepID=A0A448YFY4_BRENA|nr:DEKNAAC100812 [Brettanomyces naardenensis]